MVRETRHLWVGNLPHTIREDRILDHFKRYGKVQSVKILPKKDEESSSGGACATVAFIDIKSAAKAHNADNKIEERTLKTDYYEPPASSTASSAIFIHERDDALVVRNPAPPPQPASYTNSRNARYGLPEERNYERPGHYYERVGDREPYLRRPIGMGYHDEDSYPGRAKSRDRYIRSATGNNYTEGTDRNQNHFRTHNNSRQLFEQTRYSEQYNDERDVASTTPRLNRRTNNVPTASVVSAVGSPPPARSESRPRRNKRRSPSRTPSGSRSNSVSRSRSRSTSGSRSSSSCSKLRSSSSDSSGRSRSPSKSRSPVASYGSQSNAKRVDRPASAIANPSTMAPYLPSSISASAINCTGSIASSPNIVSLPCNSLPSLDGLLDKEEKKPLGICVRNLPVRSTDTSLKDGLFHEYKKHGKVTIVKVIGQGIERYAVVCFKKPEDVDKALEVSKDKLFFGCKIEVTAHEGLDADDNEFRPLEAEHDEYHPKATRTLFIGNLEKDITTAELRKHFEQFGEIIEIDIKKQGSSTSYAFIQYSDIASVVKAMRKLDGENLGANRVKLGFGKSMPTNCVWLDGIVDTISEKFLARHFSRFGLVAYCAIDREKGHSLIFYDSVDFAQIAVGEMRGRILNGKKLQVDFASRECQTTFFDKLEMTGQMVPGDRPWERRERRAAEFDIVRGDERETRVPFENRVYTRYEGQTRTNRGNFRGIQRTGFSGRGRGQNFANRYEMYYDEFGERRHRYNNREETTPDVSTFENKVERLKYNETIDCNNRKRNKLRNSISDQESHPSVSPPRSRHQSRSTSPVSKDRKPVKDRLHHRIKSPSSRNSSRVNSPCRDTAVEDNLDNEYKDFRSRVSDMKIELSDSDVNFSSTSPKNSLIHDGLDKSHMKTECDLSRRKSIDSENLEECLSTPEQLSQLERKRRLLVSLSKDGPLLVPKLACDRLKVKSPASHSIVNKLGQVHCFADSAPEAIESGELHEEKPRPGESANTDLKYLQKKQVHILHLLEQLREGVNSSDTEGSVDSGFSRKKKRSVSSCIDSLCSENDISKAVSKDECNTRLFKPGLQDQLSLVKSLAANADGVDGSNCFSLSLDSFVFRKQIDPRKVDQYPLSSLPKSRRISSDKEDSILPINQECNDLFVCNSTTSELPWKKQCGDSLLPNVGSDELLTIRSNIKEETSDSIVCGKKFSSELKTLRTLSDAMLEGKRERDISPLSLPLPKFAASLRSPKSSPSVLTSPKGIVQSPKTVHSPNPHGSGKGLKIPDAFSELHADRRLPETGLEEKVNGTNVSPSVSSPTESHSLPDIVDTPCLESIQSPKTAPEKVKEVMMSSDSDLSPIASPNRPSIDDQIKALDEKFNAWSGSTRTPAVTAPETSPTAVAELPKSNIKKRSRFNFLTPELRAEPSDIVKSLLSKSTIFDQDSMRLKHIDAKYEPVAVKVDTSPKIKPMFRTKAAAKEFSSPLATASLPAFIPTVHPKTPTGGPPQVVTSPPDTPHSAMSNVVLSPITPPTPHFSQGPSHLYTPCSPCVASFPSARETNDAPIPAAGEESPGDQAGLTPKGYASLKAKSDPHAIASVEQTPLVPNSVPVTLKKDIVNLKENIQLHVKENDKVCTIKKETNPVLKQNIPQQIDHPLSHLKEQNSYKNTNSIDQTKKEFSERHNLNLKDNWKSMEIIDEVVDVVSRTLPAIDTTEMKVSASTIKKRVSSVDSSGSDSIKSYKSSELSRESQDISWPKLEKEKPEMKISEPECKRPKLSLSQVVRNRSPTPISTSSKKSSKKDKSSKSEKSRSSSAKKVRSSSSIEREENDVKPVKTDFKEKPKGDNHKSKEEKKKFKEHKDSNSKSESRTRSIDKKQSQSSSESKSSSSISKPKKEHSSNKNEKSKSDRKSSGKKSTKKSKQEFEIPFQEPEYFSMYDKVKARSNKQQTMKHQAQDRESMRQKFNKLKQSRAKREDKSKSIDSDKDSDSMSQLSSDSEAKTTKSMKQTRKRKLVIESSSEDDNPFSSQDNISHLGIKDMSDSASDSDFDKKIHSKSIRNRKKKADIIESDSSDSSSELLLQKCSSVKKKPQYKSSVQERMRSFTRTEDEGSDIDSIEKVHSKEKEHKRKKMKKTKTHDSKSEKETSVSHKKSSEESKPIKKKSHKEERHSDNSMNAKHEDISRESENHIRDRKTESEVDHMDVDDATKYKNAAKKKKKSKKTSKSKEKRTTSERRSSEFTNRKDDESESKSSLPVLISPQSNSPTTDKLLSPPRLKAGDASDNDLKSDFSDLDYDMCHMKDPDSESIRSRPDLKMETHINSSKNSHKKERLISPSKLHSEFFDSDDESLIIFPEKLGKNIDKESTTKNHGSESARKKSQQSSSSSRKAKDSHGDGYHHKSKHEKTEDLSSFLKQSDSSKLFSVGDNSHSKDERRRKKLKKPVKEKKWKTKTEEAKETDNHHRESNIPVRTASPLIFESVSMDNDSRLSDLRLDEEIAKEARRLEQELLAASEETSTFGDEGPITKKEEKISERKFEEEAAKETKRLEAELFSTGRDSWHMKEKVFDQDLSVDDLCVDDKDLCDAAGLIMKDESIFATLALHSSGLVDVTEHESDLFLSADSDQYKLEDKEASELDDQRKLEDDLAVSALLQEMNNGDISAPELTKESDYLEPLLNAQPDDTMNYLLPDDGDNSLHIVDTSSPEMLVNENSNVPLDGDGLPLSPSSNSEPPPLEISNFEDSLAIKGYKSIQEDIACESYIQRSVIEHRHEVPVVCSNTLAMVSSDNKPPMIDIPCANTTLETLPESVSPRNGKRMLKKPLEYSLISEEIGQSVHLERTTSQFEDIMLDIKDSKDDDNPPVLLPVELPSRLEPSKETAVKTLVISPRPRNCSIIESPCTISNSDSVIVRAPEIEKPKTIKAVNEPNISLNITDFSTPSNNVISFTASNFCSDTREGSIFKLSKNADESVRTEHSRIDFTEPTLLVQSSSSWHKDNVLRDMEKNLTVKNSTEGHFLPKAPLLYYPDMFHRNDSINHDNREMSKCDTSVIKSTANINLNMCTEPIQKNSSEIDTIIPSDNFLQNVFPSNKDTRSVVIFNTSQLSKPKETSRIHHAFNYDHKFDNLKRVPDTLPSLKDKTPDLLPLKDVSPPKPEPETSKVPALHFPPLFTIPTTEPLLSPNNEKDNVANDVPDDNTDTAVRTGGENIKEQKEAIANPEVKTCLSKPLITVPEVILNAEIEVVPKVGLEVTEKEQETPKPQPGLVKQKLSEFEQKLSEPDSVTIPPEHVSKPQIELPEPVLEPQLIAQTCEPEPLPQVEPPCDSEEPVVSPDETLSKIKEKLDGENKFDKKAKSADAESVSSDTTDIAFPDIKTDMEMSQLTSSEELIQEDIKIVKVASRRRPERTRRGRRPKTRRGAEAAKSEITVNVVTPVVRGKRGQPVAVERTRRSLRSDTAEQVNNADKDIIICDKIETIFELEMEDKKTVEDQKTADNSKSDPLVDTDDISETTTDIEAKPPEKVYSKKTDESKRRRGRRKKALADHQTSASQEKFDSKSENNDHSKEYHRPKGSRLWQPASANKEQKISKENPKVLDIFDFVGSDEEDYTTNGKERLRDTSKAVAAAQESKQEAKPAELVHEKVKEPEPKPLSSDNEMIEKEYVTEVIQEGKLIIRRQQKYGPDNTPAHSSEAAKNLETAKNTEPTVTEDVKSEVQKSEKNSQKESGKIDGGPSKGTRKSTRLMNQTPRSTVHLEPTPSRVTRRTKTNRKSVETIPNAPSNTHKDTTADKHKNEPDFVIPDNIIKDVPVSKKSIPDATIDKAIAPEPMVAKSGSSKIVSELRKFRFNSNANTTVPTKESPETLPVSDSQKEVAIPLKCEEKNELSSNPTNKNDIAQVHPSLPITEEETPKVTPVREKEILTPSIEKENIVDDENDLLSNPTVLIDPKTGFLPSIHKKDDSPSEKFENHDSSSITEPRTSSHQSSAVSDKKAAVFDIKKIDVSQNSSAWDALATSAAPTTIDPFKSLSTSKSELTTVSETQMKELKITCGSKPKIIAPSSPNVPLSLAVNNPKAPATEETHTSAVCLTPISRSLLPASNIASRSFAQPNSKIAFPGIPGPLPLQAMKPVSVSPLEAITNLPLKVQAKTSALSDLQFSQSQQKNEAPPAHGNIMVPSTSAKEDMPDIPGNQHWNTVPSAKEGSVAPLPVKATAWPSTKLPPVNQTPVVPDMPTHMSNAIPGSVPHHSSVVDKADVRMTQPAHAHLANSSAAYLQQAGFPPPYEAQSSLQNLVTNNSGVIAELLQNPQLRQQHKEYLATTAASGAQFQDHQLVRPPTPATTGMSSEVARLGNRTPPHNPTPLVNTSSHSSDLHNPHAAGLHLRQQSYPWDMGTFVHPLYPHFAATHPEFRAQQEAQVRAAMVMSSRFGYPGVPPSAVPTGNFRQPLDPRTSHSSFVDHKSDGKKGADISNSLHDRRTPEEKSLHAIKSFRSKKKEDKDLKSGHVDDHERPGSGHDKHSFSAALRQQHLHYPSNIAQLSSHERITNSPVVANLYGSSEAALSLLQPHLHKGDNMDRKAKPPPPVAHQAHMSSLAFHNLDAQQHVRQQMLVVPPVGSPVPVYIDSRSAAKPGAYPYKKDSHLVQNMSSSEEQMCGDVAKVLPRPITHQDRPPSGQMIAPYSAYNMGQPPMIPSTEQDNHRGNPLRVDVPPPTTQNDYFIANKHPVMWQGLLELKTEHAAVQMHYVSGNCKIAIESLPNTTLKITQRMKLEQAQLDGVTRKMQTDEEHCILMALPCGKDHEDVVQQSKKLTGGFIRYLTSKGAAGIVNALKPGSQQPAYVIHIFPPSPFSQESLTHNAPKLAEIISGINHLLIIIATV